MNSKSEINWMKHETVNIEEKRGDILKFIFSYVQLQDVAQPSAQL